VVKDKIKAAKIAATLARKLQGDTR